MDSLEEMTMQDSGISEESSEVSTVSVSEEVKKFQQEITKACEENGKYKNWKHQRTGERQRSMRRKTLAYFDIGSGSNSPPEIPPRGMGILAPKLPSKKKSVPKRVSYAENEVTVFETSHFPVSQDVEKSYISSRQIEPSVYVAPAYPPSANENDDLSDTSVDDSDGDDEEEDIPVLPSVKQLANKFQILNPCQTQPVEPTKQVTPLVFY